MLILLFVEGNSYVAEASRQFLAYQRVQILTMASPALTTTELAHIIRESRPVIAFSTDTGISKVRDAFKEAQVPTPTAIYAVRGVDGLSESNGKDGEKTWTELARTKQQLVVAPMSRAEQRRTVSFILWSSGTTGGFPLPFISYSY